MRGAVGFRTAPTKRGAKGKFELWMRTLNLCCLHWFSKTGSVSVFCILWITLRPLGRKKLKIEYAVYYFYGVKRNMLKRHIRRTCTTKATMVSGRGMRLGLSYFQACLWLGLGLGLAIMKIIGGFVFHSFVLLLDEPTAEQLVNAETWPEVWINFRANRLTD